MIARKTSLNAITEHINAASKAAWKKLRKMRACIRAAAPGATESLSLSY
jgi:hypothetical protein